MTAPVRRPIDKQAILGGHPLFRGLAPMIIERLASHAVVQSVKAGTVLFSKGDRGSGLYAVCSGSVRISALSDQGKDAVFNLIFAGEIFGEIALLDGGERTADALAVEDCQFLIIERRDLLPLMREYPEIAFKMIEVLCSRLRRTSEQVEDVVFLGLPARLAKVLLRLQGDASTRIRITQREISQMIGMSRESTNKQLRDWEQRKWIKLERGGVTILSTKALAAVIADGQNE
jgi:CRP-like cAMP-binding protein